MGVFCVLLALLCIFVIGSVSFTRSVVFRPTGGAFNKIRRPFLACIFIVPLKGSQLWIFLCIVGPPVLEQPSHGETENPGKSQNRKLKKRRSLVKSLQKDHPPKKGQNCFWGLGLLSP